MSERCREAREAKRTVLAAGDWNAAWQPTDRSSGKMTSGDQKHRLAMDDMGLGPVQTTRRSKTYGCMQEGGESRIDDIFISAEATLTSPTFEDVVPMGERSDPFAPEGHHSTPSQCAP